MNGDTDERCRACGEDISGQRCLPPSTSAARAVPDPLARRNQNYLLLLLLLPVIASLLLSFWLGCVPAVFKRADDIRHRRLLANQQAIDRALVRCHADTGGVPARNLTILQRFTVGAGDLTPGANPGKWNGPYLPAGQPFPINPYRPRDGTAGWRYHVRGDVGVVTPAHLR